MQEVTRGRLQEVSEVLNVVGGVRAGFELAPAPSRQQLARRFCAARPAPAINLEKHDLGYIWNYDKPLDRWIKSENTQKE